ncbi:MAG TPA: LamG-like jellyroll fold domain-containing protein [Candidatus Baltobacteraceae bacterium]|nr:LamG-like jellyroll fold domain-containing protein [Candidatus Baltobacteraceae bacterium]
MKRNVNTTVSRHGSAPVAVNYLIAIILIFLALPSLLSAQTLEHRYSFNDDGSTNAIDSVGGTNWDGILEGNAYISNNAVVLPYSPGSTSDSPAGYVQLPNGIVTNDASITVECWLTDFEGLTWAEAWCFGDSSSGPGNPPSGGTAYISMIPTSAANGSGPIDYRAAFNLTGGDEQDVIDLAGNTMPTNMEVYSVVTYDASNTTATLYLNGVQVGVNNTIPTNLAPANYGITFNDYIGRDQFGGDPTFAGSIDELRIWNGAVSPLYIAVSEAAGPNVVVSNLTPLSVDVAITNTTMVGASTQQATVTADFSGATNIVVTGAVTTWTSSDSNVLSVSSSGLITALNGGSATVSAEIGGVRGTSVSINVSLTKPVIVQEPVSQSAYAGETAVLSVVALGGQLSYQWSLDATAIPGATSSSLTLSPLTLSDAGTYTVLVTNSLGITNSTPATLNVTATALVHSWAFNENVTNTVDYDLIGGCDGTNLNGAYLDGTNVVIPGLGFVSTEDDAPYVAFAPGIMTNLNSISVETWLTDFSGQLWAEAWCFGGGNSGPTEPGPGTNYISFIPTSPNDMRSAFKLGGGEQDVDAPAELFMPTNAQEYVVLTYDYTISTATLYLNGVVVGINTNETITPAMLGNTYDNWLGRDQYGDPVFNGSIAAMRIWNSPVSPLYQAAALAGGPTVVITNTTPSSITVTVTNSTMIASQSQQAAVTGNFPQVASVPFGGVVTWSSSDTNVLTVSSSGLVTAIAPGTATVIAMAGGTTGTSATITVSDVQPTITQAPASLSLYAGQTAVFTVGAFGGNLTYQWSEGTTPIPGATNSSLTLADLALTDAGTYGVKIVNSIGNISASATLAVMEPTLVHRWSFNDAAGSLIDVDSVGGADGTNLGNAYIDTTNGTIVLPDTTTTSTTPGASYVQFPSGILTNLNSATIEVWVTDNGPRTWAEVFSFGGSTSGPNDNDNQTNYIGLIPTSGPGDMRAAFKILNEEDVIWPFTTMPTNVEEDVALTYDNTITTGILYLNGNPVAINTNLTITPAQLGNTYNNYLGRDQFEDPIFHGSVDELRIYDGPLTATDIGNNNASGPNTLVSPGSTSKLALLIAPSGTNVMLTWQTGVLLQAPTLLGPWTTNATAVSPFTVAATNTNEFYKVLLNP